MLHSGASRVACLAGIALLSLAAESSRVHAQELPRVQVGERIRFTSASQPSWLAGTLIARNADTLVVEFSGGLPPTAIPVDSLWRLEAYRPRSHRILTYSLIGAGAGAVIVGGLYVFASAAAPCFGYCAPTTRGELMAAAGVGAVVGGVPGALIGLHQVSRRAWVRVRLPYIASVTSVADGGMGLAATVRF